MFHKSPTGHFLASLIASFAIAGTLQAASVAKILKKSRIVVVKNASAGDGFIKGAKVCFFTADERRKACGKVDKMKKSTAYVRVRNKRRLGSVKRSMLALVDGGRLKSGVPSAGVGSTKESIKVWLSYNPALLAPTGYNRLQRAIPAGGTPTTIWESAGPNSMSLVRFSLSAGIPLGDYGVHSGLRVENQVYTVDSDFIGGNRDRFASTTESVSTFGLWLDGKVYDSTIGQSLEWYLTSGLDFERSTLQFNSDHEDESGTFPSFTIATATSTVNTISLRFGFGADYMLAKNYGLHFGSQMYLPLTALGQSFEGSTGSELESIPADPGEDLKSALAHTKNSFGLDLEFGLTLAF